MVDQSPQVTEYGSLTTHDPVVRIDTLYYKDGHAHMTVRPEDFAKLKGGDIIHVTQTDNVQGHGLWEDRRFEISDGDPDWYGFEILEDGEPLEGESEFVVTGGYARVVARVTEEEVIARKAKVRKPVVKQPEVKHVEKSKDDRRS